MRKFFHTNFYGEEELTDFAPTLVEERQRLKYGDMCNGVFVFPDEKTPVSVVFKHKGKTIHEEQTNVVTFSDIMDRIAQAELDPNEIGCHVIRIFPSPTEFVITFDESDRIIALCKLSSMKHTPKASKEFEATLDKSTKDRRAMVSKHLYEIPRADSATVSRLLTQSKQIYNKVMEKYHSSATDSTTSSTPVSSTLTSTESEPTKKKHKPS